MFAKVNSLLRNFAHRLLDLEDGGEQLEQIQMMHDYAQNFKFNTHEAQTVTHLVNILKKKHLVDSIVVADRNGSTLASTSGENGTSHAVSGTALYNYIRSELPESETVMIKSNGWYMLLPYQEKVYIIEARSNLSTPELKAIAKEVECYLKANGN